MTGSNPIHLRVKVHFGWPMLWSLIIWDRWRVVFWFVWCFWQLITMLAYFFHISACNNYLTKERMNTNNDWLLISRILDHKRSSARIVVLFGVLIMLLCARNWNFVSFPFSHPSFCNIIQRCIFRLRCYICFVPILLLSSLDFDMLLTLEISGNHTQQFFDNRLDLKKIPETLWSLSSVLSKRSIFLLSLLLRGNETAVRSLAIAECCEFVESGCFGFVLLGATSSPQ